MAKQLNVSLAFTADTSQAAAQIRNLQQQLTTISNQPTGLGQHLTAEMQEASNAAAQLKMHLQNATNVKTGTLDFSKLNQSLQQSGVTLSQYASKLLSIGPQGRQAFMQLANSVASAEVPLRRSNALLTQMGTTLMNTARWQLSSSLLHGFMGAVSKAYNYSKDLNESLNNIRIVTGYNTDQMAKFAAEANKAARELSATTTAYTNASLIYYQQGLNDAEVKARTDVTIKMANVSRQSAEIVSDQMTSIWNNFYDGSRSLEYYADVVAALGAATASSSEEIATGLEKFAAVAETVGLSYEYATSALATITATTRQSADIVGTALKTLFARLSDLKLGETLEDGTTLGQYSENLAKIGVNIKDASGQLKDMDTILNETAEKWDSLDRAQQTALAKGVAGIRQYTQFIALMDNWDFMEQNLSTVDTSSGTLTKQAKIYEESWEAASKKVQASLEVIYESIMDDEFFIDLTNGFAKLIDGVGGFVKSIGGLQGVLSTLGYVLTKVFAEQMTTGFQNLAYRIQMSTEAGQILMQQTKQREMSEMTHLMASTETAAGGTASIVYTEQLQMQQDLLENAQQLTQEERLQLQMMMERKQHLADEAIALAEQSEQLKIQAGIMESKNISASWNTKGTILSPQVSGDFRKAMLDIGAAEAVLDGIGHSAEVSDLQVKDLISTFDKLGLANEDITSVINGLKGVDGAGDVAQQSLVSLRQELELIKKGQITNILGSNGFQLDASSKAYKEATADVQAWGEALINAGHKQKASTIAVENGRRVQEQFNITLGASTAATQTWAASLTNVISSLMSAGMLISSFTSLMDTLKNPDTSGWEKFGSILMSVSMIAFSLTGVFKGIKSIISLTKTLFSQETVAKIANAAATYAQVDAERKLNREKGKKGTKTTKKSIKDTWHETAYKSQQGLDPNAKMTKMKNGAYSVEGKKGFVSGKDVSGAGKGALKHMGKVALGAAVLVATIAVTAAILKAASDHYNRFEIAAKKAKETAKALNETYETVKGAESAFRDNIGQYEDAVKSLEELTKGTDEYKDAIRKANEEALELIKTHKNLKYTIGEDGLITIDPEDLEAAERDSIKAENYAYVSSIIAEQQATKAQTEADKVNFARSQLKTGGIHADSDDATIAAGGVGAGAALATGGAILTSAAVANFWNPIGWVLIGAGIIAGLVGLIAPAFNNDADSREIDALNDLAKARKNAQGSLTPDEIQRIGDLHDSTGKLSESLLKDIDATNTLVDAMVRNAEIADQQNDLMAQQLAEGNPLIEGSEHYAEIVDRSGDVLGNAVEDILQNADWLSWWGKEGIAQINGANAEAQKVWKEYLKYAKLEGKNYQLVDTTGDDNNRVFVYLDEQGNEQKVSLAQMQVQRATYEASNEVELAQLQLEKLYREWSQKLETQNQAMTSFLLQKDFGDATHQELKDLEKVISTAGSVKKYLEQTFGDELANISKTLGYATVDEFVAAVEAALKQANIDWGNISAPGAAAEGSLDTAQKMDQLIRFMNATSTQGGAAAFTTGLDTLLAGMSPDDKQLALSRIADIDWKQWDAADQVADIITELGYGINMSAGEFANWVDQINEATGAAFDHAKALENLNKLKKISDNIKAGQIISEEDFKLLRDYNLELAKYFRLLGDGTALFTGDPLDFQQQVDSKEEALLKDIAHDANENYKRAEKQEKVWNNVEKAEKKGITSTQLGTSTWGDTGEDKIVGYRDKPVDGWGLAGGILETIGGAAVTVISLLEPTPAGEAVGVTAMADGIARIGSSANPGQEPIYEDVYGVRDWSIIDAQKQFLKDMGVTDVDTRYSRELLEGNKELVDALAAEVKVYTDTFKKLEPGELQDLKIKALSAEIDYFKSLEDDERDAAVARGEVSAEAAARVEMEEATAEKWGDLDPAAVEEYAEHLQSARHLSEEAAEDVALYTMKMNKGIETLLANYEEWADILLNSSNTSEEYSLAMANMKKAMSDVLGVSEEFLTDDFITKNLKTIGEAANGSAEAIDSLMAVAAQEVLISIGFSEVQAMDMQNELLALLPDDVSVGVDVIANVDGFKEAAQDIIDTAGMTYEEAQAYFNALGYEPIFETTTAEVPLKGTRTYTDNVVIGTTALNREGVEVPFQYIAESTTHTEEVDTGKTQSIEVPVMYTNASGKKVPKIKSLTKKTSGAMNNSSGANKGGKKSGGGGSKKDKKDLNKEKERYYEINQALDTLSKKMERVGLAKERAFGKAKSDLIKQEIALLDQEIAKTDELLAEIEQYAKEDMANLAAFGFTFDADNNISNYDEIMKQEVDRYNAAIDSGDEGEIEAAEKRWEMFTDYLEQYEETMDEWDDTVTKQMEDKNKKYQLLFDDISYNIEVKLSLEEDQIKLLDHFLSMLEDEAFSAAEAISLLGDKTQATLNQAAIYADGITDILSLHGLDKETLDGVMNGSIAIEDIKDEYGFSDEDVSQIRSYVDGLMQANVDLMQLRNTVQEKVIETFQEWNEEMDKGISKIEHLGSVIDAYKNLVDLVGKATLGLDSDFMKKIANTKTKNAKDALVASQAQWKASVEAYDEAERQYNEAVKRNDKDAMEHWKDQMEELAVESDGYYAAMQESWANALQAAQDEFELTVQETVDAYEKAMAGTFGNLEALQAVFDQQNEVMDRYVADYTKIYELSKLNRDIVNSIDETDNVKAKKELRDLQEEITALQESDAQMSQYDLDYLRAKYELRLAEIALEEAQNAKSQVRMRRDSEGNYSYVFTADESEVTNAAQNYEDKLYEMQQLNNDYIREVQNNILQSEIELANALRELDRTKFASDEEYYAEVNRLTEYYTGQRNFYLEELNKSLNNNAEVYTQDWTRYSVLTDYKISADEQYLDKFTETVYAQITGYESIAEAQVVFTEATGVMVQDLHEAFETWQLHVKEVMEKAGTSIEKFGADTEKVLNDISTQSAQSAADVTSSASQFTAAFGVVCAAVSDWQIQYNSSINSAIESNVSMMTSCTNLISMLSNVGGGISTTSQQFIAAAAAIEAAAARIQAAAAAAAAAASGMPTGVHPTGTGGKMTAGGTYFGSVTVGGSNASKVIDGVTYWSAGGGWVRASDLNSNKRGITITSSSSRHTTYYIDHYYPITKYKLESLDTGGYTGEWGSNGRLALLHQKELVLNAQDTENMLSAINIIRDIARVIDLNAASSANAFALMSSTYATHSGQTIEQEVTIHAEFPNATNHSEIEEAFNTLINQAAQFANRKN